MSILACSGFEEGPGANFVSPTIGEFVKEQESKKSAFQRLRESRVGSQVIKEAKEFHENQAKKFGINTGRGLAHFRASKIYTREGNRLQEMFEKDGHLGELPPKAIIKANKAAMKFHKGQAEKAGLDSDVGHAHVAAMEHHADILKKAKDARSKQNSVGGIQSPPSKPMQASAEGGPGSGRHSVSGMKAADKAIAKYESKGYKLVKKGRTQGTTYFEMKTPSGNKTIRRYMTTYDDLAAKKKEALPGHGSKQSPVPVPKKSDQPSEDVMDGSKPTVRLNPQDANKPLRKLQQGVEGGPGSGPRAHGGSKGKSGSRIPKHNQMKAKVLQQHGFKRVKDGRFKDEDGKTVPVHIFQKGKDIIGMNASTNKYNKGVVDHFRVGPSGGQRLINQYETANELHQQLKSKESSRESNTRSRLDDGLGKSFPKGAGRLLQPNLVFRGPRTKESSKSSFESRLSRFVRDNSESRRSLRRS